MECRPGCAACCIAPSISTALPGFPAGKPAGARCPHLTVEDLCALFGHPSRPEVCRSLRPEPEMCGATRAQAMAWFIRVEALTSPPPPLPPPRR